MMNCMKYFTGLLQDSDVDIFGRNTYHDVSFLMSQ